MKTFAPEQIFMGRMSGEIVLVDDFFGSNDRRDQFVVEETKTVVNKDQDLSLSLIRYKLARIDQLPGIISDIRGNFDQADIVNKLGQAISARDCKALHINMCIFATEKKSEGFIKKYKCVEDKSDFDLSSRDIGFSRLLRDAFDEFASNTVAGSVEINGKANTVKMSHVTSNQRFNELIREFALIKV